VQVKIGTSGELLCALLNGIYPVSVVIRGKEIMNFC
jgi:hypothetical protein